MTEHVLAIKNTGDFKTGFNFETPDFNLSDLMMGSRDWLEKDPTFLQLIPYCLIVDENNDILAYVRKKGGGEAKLFDKLSVGVGGHINPEDFVVHHSAVQLETIVHATKREISEEIVFSEGISEQYKVFTDAISDISFVGTVYDPSNEVGQVHLGLVCLVRLDGFDEKYHITTRDKGMELRGFLSKDYLLAEDSHELETWSKLVLEGLDLGV